MEKYLVNTNTSLVEALKKIEVNNEKHVIVINKKGKAVGVMSDGDVRRAILKNIQLSSNISRIYNKKFFYFKEKELDKKKAIDHLIKNKMMFAPILNSKKEPVGTIVIDYAKIKVSKIKKNFDKIKNIPVVIMAGGQGTRLQPFTHILPKPLIPIGDQTVIEKIIEKFRNYKINNFIITLNYKSKIIKSFFKEINLKENINFLVEKNPLGTIGSLNKLKKKLKGNFFLTNADSIIDIDMNDFIEFHEKNNNDITIVAALKKYEISYGSCVIDRDGNLKSIDEKPKYDLLINTGLYLLNSRILKFINQNKKMDMDELLNILIKNKKKIKIYPISEINWKDVGQWDEYNKLKAKIV